MEEITQENVPAVAFGEKRSAWRIRMIARLEEKIDLLVEAIDERRIEGASLAQVGATLRTLVDKAEALREADEPGWEEMKEVLETERKQMCKDVAAVVKRHVHEPETLAAIALDLEAVSKGRELAPVVPLGVPSGVPSSELAALEDVRLPSQMGAGQISCAPGPGGWVGRR